MSGSSKRRELHAATMRELIERSTAAMRGVAEVPEDERLEVLRTAMRGVAAAMFNEIRDADDRMLRVAVMVDVVVELANDAARIEALLGSTGVVPSGERR